jgi:hypothetical protein
MGASAFNFPPKNRKSILFVFLTYLSNKNIKHEYEKVELIVNYIFCIF